MSAENTKNWKDDNPVRDLFLNNPGYRDIDIRAAMIIDNAMHMGFNFPEGQKNVNMCDLLTEWKKESVSQRMHTSNLLNQDEGEE